MSNGKLIPPNLDDRKWQVIVDEAKALIPKYAPEWTDHNPSDLGITLIELFASIVEGMIYRLNRVPERNYIEFLNLLGITRDPATPASTFLTYRLAPGTPATTIPKGSQAATPQTEKEEGIVFETDRDIIVWPIKTALFLERPALIPIMLPIKFQNVSTNLISSPLSGMNVNLVRSVYYHIFLGFDSSSPQEISMLFSFLKPAKKDDIQISWQYSSGGALRSIPISSIQDGTNTFQKNGSVTLTVPENWTSENMSTLGNYLPNSPPDAVNQPLFWIVIVIHTALISPIQIGIEHILFNSVPATNAITTTQPELLGVSNEKPFQFFELKNRPLFKKPGAQDPYDHLEIQIREPQVGGGLGLWKKWNRIEDFPKGPEELYRLNPVTGTINFGNYDAATSTNGHGKIPPQGSEIQALPYRYVIGGKKGNVPPDTIKTFRTPPPAGVVSVTNLAAASGGLDEEDFEETKRRGPEVLRNRYRAVTVEDYEYLAREATMEVKKVRCLPPRLITDYEDSTIVGQPWTYGGLNRGLGNVNVIIIPDSTLSNPTPMPSEELLQKVSDYLEERHSVTAKLHVTSPRYLPIHVIVEINIWQKAIDDQLTTENQITSEIDLKIQKYLHPILGGPDGKGWEVGQDITISGLFEFIKPSSDKGFISSLQIQNSTPINRPPFSSTSPSAWVKLADYEIVCNCNDPPHEIIPNIIRI